MSEQAHCANCGQYTTASYCGRCQLTVYCSRNCQSTHWPIHKKTCIDPAQLRAKYDKYLEYTMKRIMGNILVIIAHNDPTHGRHSAITARLDETIDGFIGTNSLHIVHLTYTTACDNTSPRGVATGREGAILVPVAFVLKDYKRTLELDMSIAPDLNIVKKNHPHISETWSIVFEM